MPLRLRHPPELPDPSDAGSSAAAPESGVAELVRRAASRDARAWRELVDAYSGRVYGLLLRQCGDRELAEELTQATFVKLVDNLTGGQRGAGSYDERGRFESWLFRIATNALRDELRRRKRQARPTDMTPAALEGREEPGGRAVNEERGILRGPAAACDPAHTADMAERLERLREAVASLPDLDREVLYLRHTAGLSFAQIADTLQSPLGTVLARAHRALAKLRKLLPDLVEPPGSTR